MKTFVFLGSFSQVLSETPGESIKLTRFGQRVELSDDAAEQTRHPRGLPVIPAEDFDALGFTADDLRKFGAAQSHENAPAEFLQKKMLALQALHEYRGGE